MLDFVFITLIFFEIILTTLCVIKITEAEKEVKKLHKKLILTFNLILEINEQIKTRISKINKVVSFITNKKLIKISQIIRTIIDIIQIILLLRSLNLSKGLKSINYKNIKKLILVETSRRILRKILMSM